MLSITLFSVLLLSVSAHTERHYTTTIGTNAPTLELKTDNGRTFSMAGMRGRYVLVNFWASTDAESRITANRYDRLANSAEESQVALVSVNMDSNEGLYREIVRIDGLNEETQFHVDPIQASELVERFDMTSGLQSFLIAPDGKIAAVNPSPQTIAKHIGS